MGSARRLYLYLVSGVSLLVLAIGVSELLAVALGEVVDRLGTTLVAGDTPGREQLSLAIALVLVGGPVYALHWWLVRRGRDGTGPEADADRRSALRALYLGIVTTGAAATALYAAVVMLDRAFRALVGIPAEDGRITDDVARLLVAVPLWWIHLARRNEDLRTDRQEGAAAWLSRLVRYGWLAIGMFALATGVSQLIDALASALIAPPGVGGDGSAWWLGPSASALALIVGGALVAWPFLRDARRAVRDADRIGEDERATRLRLAYYGVLLLVAIGTGGLAVAAALTEAGRQALGVAEETGTRAILETVVGPVLVAIPFPLVGWLHWTVLRDEASERGPDALAAAERIALHLLALIGIVFLAVGAARLIGLVLELTVGGVPVDDGSRADLVWCVAQVVVGIGLWLPGWGAIVRRRAAAPLRERLAPDGRAYLLLVVAGALVAGIPSTVFVAFRVIDTALGGRAADLASDIAIPIGAVVVAAILTAYHARLVVADQRLAPQETAPSLEASKTASASLTLVLRGPSRAELEAVAASIRERLPGGVSLDDR